MYFLIQVFLLPLNPQYESLCLTSCRSAGVHVLLCVSRDMRKQNGWVIPVRLAGKSKVQECNWNKWQMAEFRRLKSWSYTIYREMKAVGTVSDHLSWGNKKTKCFLELEVYRRNYQGKFLNYPCCIYILVGRVLPFEEKPGTWAGKVLTYMLIDPHSFGGQRTLPTGCTMECDRPVVTAW